MDCLVIRLLQFSIHLKIVDIDVSVVLEPLIISSFIVDALLIFVLLQRLILLLHAVQQIIYGIFPLLLVVGCAHRNYCDIEILL